MARSRQLFRAGKSKSAPTGFSWTTFFFSFWPSVLRGHFVFAFAQIIIELVAFVVVLGLLAGVGKVYGVISPLAFFFFVGLLVALRAYIASRRNLRLYLWYCDDGWVEWDERPSFPVAGFAANGAYEFASK